ncbi:MAG: phage terminase small subunit P27 family [Rhodobacterales bacterium]|nr:MAG: phage terminase small subunit P27 family [Rhodobacterales bacterium]
MKGAKPKPTNVVPMKGEPVRHVPDAPEWLSSEARDVWDDLAPHLVTKDRLKPEFTYQFASYCESVANFMAATACVALEGRYYSTKTRNGVQQKKTAAWGLQQESMNQMRRDSAIFGLSPVDEARLSSGDQGDLFDTLMQQLKNGSD